MWFTVTIVGESLWRAVYFVCCSTQRHASFSTALVRSHGRLQHKRSTLEILMRGKMVGSETPVTPSFSHPHRFEKHNLTTPTYCDLCSNLLWGPVKVRFVYNIIDTHDNVLGLEPFSHSFILYSLKTCFFLAPTTTTSLSTVVLLVV